MLARRCLLRLPTSSRGVWHRSATEQSPPLKGWQEDAIQACTDAINGGLSRIGVQLMPGESNQILSPVLMDRIPPSPKNLGATRLLFVGLSPNRAEGYAVHMQRYGPAHWHIEVDRNEATAASQADVLLTTYKDMEQARVIKRYDQSKLKAIILDQAHRPKPAFYDSLRRSLESRPNVPQPVVIGMFKSFEDELSSFFQSIVFRRDVLNTFQENWECSARFLAVPAPLGLRNINMAQTTHASNAMSRDEVVESTVHALRDMAATRKTTLVYCVDLRHARKLGTAFQEAGIVARVLGFPGTIGERMAYQATLCKSYYPSTPMQPMTIEQLHSGRESSLYSSYTLAISSTYLPLTASYWCRRP
ncbi:hypothetical protein B0H11DRAFT_2075129 [Mycena galericulata]|nr:hypothetical protein B0H11DRAFT_2075129 [Mycena galericulata]